MRRQMAREPAPIHIRAHMREHRAPHAKTRDPFQHTFEMGVRLVRRSLKTADEPGVDALQNGERRLIECYDIGLIGEIAGPEAERRDEAVILKKDARRDPRHFDALAGDDDLRRQDRAIEE